MLARFSSVYVYLNMLSSPLLSDSKFFEILKSVLTDAKCFEVENGFRPREAKKKALWAEFKTSNFGFFARNIMPSWNQYILLAKTMLLWPAAVEVLQFEGSDEFAICLFNRRILATFNKSNTALLLWAAKKYPTISDNWKVDHFVQVYFKASSEYDRMLQTLILKTCSTDRFRPASLAFNEFVDYEMTHSKSSISKTWILECFWMDLGSYNGTTVTALRSSNTKPLFPEIRV